MDRASSVQDDELSLELTLAAVAPATGTPDGFFLCVYCGRKFHSSQAGGHQNAHNHERAIARRRREGAAAAVTRAQDVRSSVSVASMGGTAAADSVRKPEDPTGGNGSGSSSERRDEVDLSLRL